jgi:hypothetical protein
MAYSHLVRLGLPSNWSDTFTRPRSSNREGRRSPGSFWGSIIDLQTCGPEAETNLENPPMACDPRNGRASRVEPCGRIIGPHPFMCSIFAGRLFQRLSVVRMYVCGCSYVLHCFAHDCSYPHFHRCSISDISGKQRLRRSKTVHDQSFWLFPVGKYHSFGRELSRLLVARPGREVSHQNAWNSQAYSQTLYRHVGGYEFTRPVQD